MYSQNFIIWRKTCFIIGIIVSMCCYGVEVMDLSSSIYDPLVINAEIFKILLEMGLFDDSGKLVPLEREFLRLYAHGCLEQKPEYYIVISAWSALRDQRVSLSAADSTDGRLTLRRAFLQWKAGGMDDGSDQQWESRTVYRLSAPWAAADSTSAGRASVCLGQGGQQMGNGAFPCLKIRKREQPPTYTLLTPARSKKRIHEKQEASWPPVFSYSPAAPDAIQNPMPRRASEGAEKPKDFRWPVLNLIPAVSLTFVLRQRYARRRPPRPRPIHTPPCQQ